MQSSSSRAAPWGHSGERRHRPKSVKPARPRVTLTCVDTGDDVSLLGTGAIRDPRLLSLLQPEDQIRLGDWVSCPGKNRQQLQGPACRPRPHPHSTATTGSSLRPFQDQPSHLPAPAGRSHTPFSLEPCPDPQLPCPAPSTHCHLQGARPSPPSPDSSPLEASGECTAQRPEQHCSSPEHVHLGHGAAGP